LERKIPSHDCSLWADQASSREKGATLSIEEGIKTVILKQAPEDITDRILLAPKEQAFRLIALLVRAGRFQSKNILLFLKFLRSCTPQEKTQFFALIRPCLSSQSEVKWRVELEELFEDSSDHSIYPTTRKEIKGVTLGRKRIPESMYTHLSDEKGNLKKGQKNNEYLHGRSRVNFYPEKNPVVYFKKKPELPGYEYAATEFMRMMGIESLPFSELAMFYNSVKKKQYPMLLSQAVAGDMVCDVWDDNDLFKNLDSYHTGLLILAAMLINPEDGKEDNYILTPDRTKLIPIDNDHAFIPGTIWKREGSGGAITPWTVTGTLQTKTLLFCLDMMNKPIPDAVRTHFLTLDPNEFLARWLNNLVKVNDTYQNLFPDLAALYPKTILRIPLSQGYIEQLYWKMHTLQKHLKEGLKKDSTTYLDLLQKVEPYISKLYMDALEDKSKKTVKERFLSVTSGYYKTTANSDSRLSAANSRELMKILKIPKEDLIGVTNKVQTGPSSALEMLKGLIFKRTEQEKKRDEILRGTQELDNPIDCKGLSTAKQMQHLNQILGGTKVIAGLALRNCTALDSTHLGLRPEFKELGTFLQFLDLRGASQLNEWAFKTIYETCPNVEYLNISGWKELWYLYHYDEVKMTGIFIRGLDDSGGQPQAPILPVLKRLVVNDCPYLEHLCLCLPQVKTIEANRNIKLEVIKIHNGDKTLRQVSIENCPFLPSSVACD
ncbi:hypothetical protein H0W26_00855, partial [Candidatus Dependentiae bacterium]|nr:hypothetical protein [Candidatus Dependentiae bacterium]